MKKEEELMEKERQEQETDPLQDKGKNTKQHPCRSAIGAHCMMGRGRFHHHVSTKRSGD